MTLIAPAVVTLLVASACMGSGGGHMQDMHRSQAGEVQGSLDEMPVEEFFETNCGTCHGNRRQGGIGPPLLPGTLVKTNDYYFEVIAEGSPGTAMGGWLDSGLAPEDIRTLVVFLKTEPANN